MTIPVTTDYAVQCAREYATQFNTNSFAIHHLANALEVDYSKAKELFYHYDVKEEKEI